MLIILEGPDGGGKSTLAQKARESKRLGAYPKIEFISQLGGRTMTHEEMRKNTYRLLNDFRNGRYQDKTVICERLHAVSDEVYRGLFGGDYFLSQAERRSFFHDLGLRMDVRVVYCRPPVQAVIDHGLQKAGDDTEEWLEEVAAKLRPLYDAYDAVMNRLTWEHAIPIVRYDYTSAGATQLEQTICAA